MTTEISMLNNIESPRMTLRLHAMICAQARLELHRQREALHHRYAISIPRISTDQVSRNGNRKSLEDAILRTLLYFDIWNHPLTIEELRTFLPLEVRSQAALLPAIEHLCAIEVIAQDGRHFSIHHAHRVSQNSRETKERRAFFMWKMARVATAFIKMFPYVRAVWVSGELSKNIASPHADVDFFIVTEPGRLWITRAMLIVFKKIFLLNSKKFFCLNSFIDVRNLESCARNMYQAIEIASLKPLYNPGLLRKFFQANAWVWSYFPNFDPNDIALSHTTSRRSVLQRVSEKVFSLIDADALEDRLMRTMQALWRRRYPQIDDATRDRILRSTKSESRAFFGDFEEKVLTAYKRNLHKYHLAGDED